MRSRYGSNGTESSDLERERTRRLLESKRKELARLSAAREAVQVDRSADEMDQLVSLHYADIAAQAIDTGHRTMKAVEDALRRIQDGSYGICEGCGLRIHPKRLEAVPWAAMCVRCQDLADQKAA